MIWLDAHLSPRIADFITEALAHDAVAVRDVGLREAEDRELFEAARQRDVTFVTKDRDFVELIARMGPPPRVI